MWSVQMTVTCHPVGDGQFSMRVNTTVPPNPGQTSRYSGLTARGVGNQQLGKAQRHSGCGAFRVPACSLLATDKISSFGSARTIFIVSILTVTTFWNSSNG